MPETVISVENVSKEYRLGVVGSGTVSSDLSRLWAKIRGKEDPTLQIGVVNKIDALEGDYIWALKDISFTVRQGDVLGIIGKNGAGKSTLLKILSKVTAPTTGYAKIKGRIASLLEVGTGFHPELTGRENIFLNGAILGMTKNEIRRKYDEIIDFSGVEKYIDTPVKRYSSGMYVRLAFAVAAHLEPDILIVDEVLAVGDAEFQRRCLGKIKSVSDVNGRTVIFVSHNMAAITSLCKTTILLENGIIKESGHSDMIVSNYLKCFNTDMRTRVSWEREEERPGDAYVEMISCRITDEKGNDTDFLKVTDAFFVETVYRIKSPGVKPGPNFLIRTQDGAMVFQSLDTSNNIFDTGVHKSVCRIPANFLNDGSYVMTISLTNHNPTIIHCGQDLFFDVVDDLNSPARGDYMDKMYGVVRPVLSWQNTIL